MRARYQVIKASAGGGKTHRLVLKFLKTLFRLYSEEREGRWLRRVLAITFTNAAADEMRERVISALKGFSIPEMKTQREEELERELREEFGEEFIRTASPRILDYIIANYSDLEIRTIDSFVHFLIRSIPFETGAFLAPEKEVENQGAYIGYAVDLIFKKSRTDPDIRKTLEEFIDTLLGEISGKGEGMNWDVKSFVLRKVKGFREKEVNLARELKKYEGIENKEEEFRRKYGASPWEVVEGKRGKNFSSGEIEEAVDLLSKLKNSPSFIIYGAFKNQLMEVKKRKRLLFLEELNLLARNIIKGNEVDFIFEKLGERILHFMIDEFQDTSGIQWDNLLPLIEEALSKGGEFFCVGDSKQAIYGFRGGNPLLLEDLCKKPFEIFPSVSDSHQIEVIEKNFRSGREIVEFINEVFNHENLEKWSRKIFEAKGYVDKEFTDKLKEVYKDSSQKALREGGFVFVRRIPAKSRDEDKEDKRGALLEMVYGEITERFEVLERFSLKDICFLVRKNEEVEAVTSFLLSKGIPVDSEITTDIRTNYLMREIVEFLHFLDFPSDDLSFASFITGRLFERASGMASLEFYRWIERKKAEKREVPLYIQFRTEFPDLWKRFFSVPFSLAGFLPLYDLLSTILNIFRAYELFPDHLPFLRHLEDTVTMMEKEKHCTIASFRERWRGNREDDRFNLKLPFRADAVKVMTMHKAKGLEFPVVVIPFLSLSHHSKPISDNEIFIESEGDTFSVYYQRKEWRMKSPKLDSLYKTYISKGLLEEVNLLYVALTRAKEELYVFLPEAEKVSNFYIPLLLGENSEMEKGRLFCCSRAEGKEVKISSFTFPERKRWDERLIRERKPLEWLLDEKGRKMRKAGEALHSFLSTIDSLPPDDEIEKWFEKKWNLFLESTASEEIKDELAGLKETLFRFLNDEGVKKFFTISAQDKVFVEKEILAEDGSVRRVDRIIVRGRCVEVIDFKWAEAGNEEHRKQMRDYLSLLSRIFPSMDVRGYLLYIDSRKVEEVR